MNSMVNPAPHNEHDGVDDARADRPVFADVRERRARYLRVGGVAGVLAMTAYLIVVAFGFAGPSLEAPLGKTRVPTGVSARVEAMPPHSWTVPSGTSVPTAKDLPLHASSSGGAGSASTAGPAASGSGTTGAVDRVGRGLPAGSTLGQPVTGVDPAVTVGSPTANARNHGQRGAAERAKHSRAQPGRG